MGLLETLLHYYDVQVRVNTHPTKGYTVSCWCDTERVVYATGKDLNKTMLTAFNKFVNLQGETAEDLKQIKSKLKYAIPRNLILVAK